MNIQEMHLSVKQGVDKIHAQVADGLLSSEIDRELNKAIQRFVTTRFTQSNRQRKGFEESQKRRDDLRTLVTELSSPAYFKETLRWQNSPSGQLWIDTVPLPANYMFLIDVQADVWTNPNCTPLEWTLETVAQNQYFFTTDLVNFWGQGNTEFIVGVALVENSSVLDGIFEPVWEWGGTGGDGAWTSIYVNDDGTPQTNIWPFLGNSDDTTDPSGLGFIPDVLEMSELSVGWQNNPNDMGVAVTYPGNFVFSIDIDTYPWINWDPSLGNVTQLVGYNSEMVATVFAPLQFDSAGVGQQRRIPVFNFDWNTQADGSAHEFVNCRMVQHDDVLTMIDDPFNKTKNSSPLTVMRGRFVDIYADNMYVVNRLRFTYIRRPALVNIGTGVNCDLPVHTHEEIIMFAVSSILETISDPRYRTHLLESDTME